MTLHLFILSASRLNWHFRSDKSDHDVRRRSQIWILKIMFCYGWRTSLAENKWTTLWRRRRLRSGEWFVLIIGSGGRRRTRVVHTPLDPTCFREESVEALWKDCRYTKGRLLAARRSNCQNGEWFQNVSNPRYVHVCRKRQKCKRRKKGRIDEERRLPKEATALRLWHKEEIMPIRLRRRRML